MTSMGCSHSSLSMTINPECNGQQSGVDKNHFISTGLLGEGGFGRVVAAMFVKNSNWYAVKEINKVMKSSTFYRVFSLLFLFLFLSMI
jgi:serine/threonine protein kinase